LDIDTMSDSELADAAASAQAELERRQKLADAARRTDAMLLDYLVAEGRENGAAWQAPVGIIGAYPRGWRVEHAGAHYDATQLGVTTEPPGDGWEPATGPLVPFWQPGPFQAGDLARDAGRVWRALADVHGSRPSEYPGGWELVEAE
jgi:hypothetical protein